MIDAPLTIEPTPEVETELDRPQLLPAIRPSSVLLVARSTSAPRSAI
jgi:hypothetical protein